MGCYLYGLVRATEQVVLGSGQRSHPMVQSIYLRLHLHGANIPDLTGRKTQIQSTSGSINSWANKFASIGLKSIYFFYLVTGKSPAQGSQLCAEVITTAVREHIHIEMYIICI